MWKVMTGTLVVLIAMGYPNLFSYAMPPPPEVLHALYVQQVCPTKIIENCETRVTECLVFIGFDGGPPKPLSEICPESEFTGSSSMDECQQKFFNCSELIKFDPSQPPSPDQITKLQVIQHCARNTIPDCEARTAECLEFAENPCSSDSLLDCIAKSVECQKVLDPGTQSSQRPQEDPDSMQGSNQQSESSQGPQEDLDSMQGKQEGLESTTNVPSDGPEPLNGSVKEDNSTQGSQENSPPIEQILETFALHVCSNNNTPDCKMEVKECLIFMKFDGGPSTPPPETEICQESEIQGNLSLSECQQKLINCSELIKNGTSQPPSEEVINRLVVHQHCAGKNITNCENRTAECLAFAEEISGSSGSPGSPSPAGPFGPNGSNGEVLIPELFRQLFGASGPGGFSGPGGPQSVSGEGGPGGQGGPIGPGGLFGPEGLGGLFGKDGPGGQGNPFGPGGLFGPEGLRGLFGKDGPGGQGSPFGPGGQGNPFGPRGPGGPFSQDGSGGQSSPIGLEDLFGPEGLGGLFGPEGLGGLLGKDGPGGQGIPFGPGGQGIPFGPGGPGGLFGPGGPGGQSNPFGGLFGSGPGGPFTPGRPTEGDGQDPASLLKRCAQNPLLPPCLVKLQECQQILDEGSPQGPGEGPGPTPGSIQGIHEGPELSTVMPEGESSPVQGSEIEGHSTQRTQEGPTSTQQTPGSQAHLICSGAPQPPIPDCVTKLRECEEYFPLPELFSGIPKEDACLPGDLDCNMNFNDCQGLITILSYENSSIFVEP